MYINIIIHFSLHIGIEHSQLDRQINTCRYWTKWLLYVWKLGNAYKEYLQWYYISNIEPCLKLSSHYLVNAQSTSSMAVGESRVQYCTKRLSWTHYRIGQCQVFLREITLWRYCHVMMSMLFGPYSLVFSRSVCPYQLQFWGFGDKQGVMGIRKGLMLMLMVYCLFKSIINIKIKYLLYEFKRNESECRINKLLENHRFMIHKICLFHTPIHSLWTNKKYTHS